MRASSGVRAVVASRPPCCDAPRHRRRHRHAGRLRLGELPGLRARCGSASATTRSSCSPRATCAALVLTANLGRLLRLEGCLAGNPPEGVDPLPGPCTELAELQPGAVRLRPRDLPQPGGDRDRRAARRPASAQPARRRSRPAGPPPDAPPRRALPRAEQRLAAQAAADAGPPASSRTSCSGSPPPYGLTEPAQPRRPELRRGGRLRHPPAGGHAEGQARLPLPQQPTRRRSSSGCGPTSATPSASRALELIREAVHDDDPARRPARRGTASPRPASSSSGGTLRGLRRAGRRRGAGRDPRGRAPRPLRRRGRR